MEEKINIGLLSGRPFGGTARLLNNYYIVCTLCFFVFFSVYSFCTVYFVLLICGVFYFNFV